MLIDQTRGLSVVMVTQGEPSYVLEELTIPPKHDLKSAAIERLEKNDR